MPRATSRRFSTTSDSSSDSGPEQAWVDRPGGVFLARTELVPIEDQVLLQAAARVVMDGADGVLRDQLVRPQVPLPAQSEPHR